MKTTSTSAAVSSAPLQIETDQEDDGRWLAEVVDMPGVMTYGATEQEAIDRVRELAARVMAEWAREDLATWDAASASAWDIGEPAE